MLKAALTTLLALSCLLAMLEGLFPRHLFSRGISLITACLIILTVMRPLTEQKWLSFATLPDLPQILDEAEALPSLDLVILEAARARLEEELRVFCLQQGATATDISVSLADAEGIVIEKIELAVQTDDTEPLRQAIQAQYAPGELIINHGGE